VLDEEHWQSWCAEQNLDASRAETLRDSQVHKKLLARLAGRLRDFPGYAQVRRAHFTLEPWTVENGYLTPTMKTRRNRIAERHAQEIEAMFRNLAG